MTNYSRGRTREYRVMKMLEKVGYTCFRMAGSHGLFDVIALGKDHMKLIQVKYNQNASPAERESIALFTLGPKEVSKEIWLFRTGRRDPIIYSI